MTIHNNKGKSEKDQHKPNLTNYQVKNNKNHLNQKFHHQNITYTHKDIDNQFKTIKVSIQKSEEIGNKQYKKALQHMKHVNDLEKRSRQNQAKQLQSLTSQHTFKPQINDESQLNYLYQSNLFSAQKNSFRRKQNQGQRFYDRLMKWGKNHDERIRNNYVRGKISKEGIQNLMHKSMQKSRQKNVNFQGSFNSIEKIQNKIISSIKSSNKTEDKRVKTLVNGEQSFYQRQAKAVAIKNGEAFYYSSDYL